MVLFLSNVENITVNHILPETRFCGLHLCNLNHCDIIATNNTTKFSEITQNIGHYAIQGHQFQHCCDDAGCRHLPTVRCTHLSSSHCRILWMKSKHQSTHSTSGTISHLPKLCVKITIFMQGHV